MIRTRWSVGLAVVGAALMTLAAPSAALADVAVSPLETSWGLLAVIICGVFVVVTSTIAVIGLRRVRARVLDAASAPDRGVADSDD